MSGLSSSTQKADMYNWSRCHDATQACALYSERRAVQRLGPGAWHQCNESCWHINACLRCEFSVESDNGLGPTCLILEIMVSEEVSFSSAYDQAKERIKGSD